MSVRATDARRRFFEVKLALKVPKPILEADCHLVTRCGEMLYMSTSW